MPIRDPAPNGHIAESALHCTYWLFRLCCVEMENYLKDWGLENLISTFKENDIDDEIFYELTEELIKELISSVGLRMKFLKNFRAIKPQEQEEQASDLNASTTSLVTSIESCATENVISNNNENVMVIPLENFQSSFIGLENIIVTPSMPDFDLRTLLSTSAKGLSVLNYYQTNKSLTQTYKNRLVDIIVNHLLTYIINQLRFEEYNIITAKIISLFPNETFYTYFVPGIKKSESNIGRPILTKGKLVNKVRNLLFISPDTVPCKRRQRPFEATDEQNTKKYKADVSVENDILMWLQTRTEPWSDVSS